mmetsp:Transcript_6669/g.19238  ORF Transcript_6669/g.19238 Transcript_6669/m.19238 type:complete len:485 (+) Transcript_6669:503-1957(+)
MSVAERCFVVVVVSVLVDQSHTAAGGVVDQEGLLAERTTRSRFRSHKESGRIHVVPSEHGLVVSVSVSVAAAVANLVVGVAVRIPLLDGVVQQRPHQEGAPLVRRLGDFLGPEPRKDPGQSAEPQLGAKGERPAGTRDVLQFHGFFGHAGRYDSDATIFVLVVLFGKGGRQGLEIQDGHGIHLGVLALPRSTSVLCCGRWFVGMWHWLLHLHLHLLFWREQQSVSNGRLVLDLLLQVGNRNPHARQSPGRFGSHNDHPQRWHNGGVAFVLAFVLGIAFDVAFHPSQRDHRVPPGQGRVDKNRVRQELEFGQGGRPRVDVPPIQDLGTAPIGIQHNAPDADPDVLPPRCCRRCCFFVCVCVCVCVGLCLVSTEGGSDPIQALLRRCPNGRSVSKGIKREVGGIGEEPHRVPHWLQGCSSARSRFGRLWKRWTAHEADHGVRFGFGFGFGFGSGVTHRTGIGGFDFALAAILRDEELSMVQRRRRR